MDALAKLTKLIRELMNAGFFGKVTISFQNGKPHTVTTERVNKLDELQ